jgi:hypothetical protein
VPLRCAAGFFCAATVDFARRRAQGRAWVHFPTWPRGRGCRHGRR